MSPKVDSIFAQAMELSEDERVELADGLFNSVSPERQEEVDRWWAEEAGRRFDAFKQGKVASVPYEDAMRAIRERLNK